MGKPIRQVEIETFDGAKGNAMALFDSGAHQSFIREDLVPPGAVVARRDRPLLLRTAARGGELTVTGALVLSITVGEKMIQGSVLVSPDLGRELIVGAGLMQEWDITILNENGRTEVRIGKDMRDPDVQEIA